MNPSEKLSKYTCFSGPPACEFVEPVAQDLEPWSESRRAGGVDWKPWAVTEFNYQKIEEFRQNWKVVLQKYMLSCNIKISISCISYRTSLETTLLQPTAKNGTFLILQILPPKLGPFRWENKGVERPFLGGLFSNDFKVGTCSNVDTKFLGETSLVRFLRISSISRRSRKKGRGPASFVACGFKSAQEPCHETNFHITHL